MPRTDWGPSSFRARLTVACGTGAAYGAAFLAIHAWLGTQAIALTAVPLIVGGLLFGVRGGIVTWLLVIPLNALLHLAIGLGPTVFIQGEGPVRLVVAFAVAVVVGRLRDLSLALSDEAARRQAEALQRASAEARLQATLAAIPDLMLRIARDGTLLDYHAGTAADVPMPTGLVAGSRLDDLLPPALAQILPAVGKTLETGRPQRVEYQVPQPRGAQDYEARMIASGPEEVLAIVRNVTERKRLDEVLRQQERDRLDAQMKDQLIIADRQVAIGTLAAGTAHEINNPLTYVVANLGFLGKTLDRLGAALGPQTVPLDSATLLEMRRMAQEISEGVDKIRVIVRDLVTFSRADGEAKELVDVREQLDLAIGLSKTELSRKALIVRDYAEVPSVEASPARLGQIFLNLLINAAQAILEGAPAENEIRIVVQTDRAGGVLVEVRDTGCGISPEARDHLFEPFFTTKKVGVGTGLGLYVCHNLVGSLGGTITAESAPERGSIFRVLLPASASAAGPSVNA